MTSAHRYDTNPNTSVTARKIYNIIDDLEEKINRRVTPRNENNNFRYDANISYVLPYNNLNVTSIPISDQIRVSNPTTYSQTILPASQILIESPPKRIVQNVVRRDDEVIDIKKQIQDEFNLLIIPYQNYQKETNEKISNLFNIINKLNEKTEKSIILDEVNIRGNDLDNINRDILEMKKKFNDINDNLDNYKKNINNDIINLKKNYNEINNSFENKINDVYNNINQLNQNNENQKNEINRIKQNFLKDQNNNENKLNEISMKINLFKQDIENYKQEICKLKNSDSPVDKNKNINLDDFEDLKNKFSQFELFKENYNSKLTNDEITINKNSQKLNELSKKFEELKLKYDLSNNMNNNTKDNNCDVCKFFDDKKLNDLNKLLNLNINEILKIKSENSQSEDLLDNIKKLYEKFEEYNVRIINLNNEIKITKDYFDKEIKKTNNNANSDTKINELKNEIERVKQILHQNNDNLNNMM